MLSVKNLSKKYHKNSNYSITDISFDLNKGEILGLIGKNGAGKTTLMKIIAKTLKPTTGEVLIDDINILNKNNSLKNVGFIIEPEFFKHLTAIQNIKYYLDINKLDYSPDDIKLVLELVDLWHVKDKKPSQFSFGMKQRLGLACCLASQPNYLIMDEPFVGLDPNGVEMLIKKLKEWVFKNNTAVLISSHQLSELEEICDKYIYIENGKISKSIDRKGNYRTVLYLEKDINPNDFSNFPDTYINEKIVYTSIEGNRFHELISLLSKNNTILKIDKEDSLKDLFKGGIE